ncbi:uncharacterized protein LOC125045534 [Penaeus chinensis]|uniref:uncharacterized protein LOC125045534 n=1 Tax=Penaeus chinensis TaxID=139456 RepID=UPI001FB653E6|nr:uncharacterized protein LOC125045534 [Penaeus chinensis]
MKPKNHLQEESHESDSAPKQGVEDTLTLSEKVQDIPFQTPEIDTGHFCSGKDVPKGKKRKLGQGGNKSLREAAHNGKILRKSPRPNYFVGIRVSDCEIHRAIVRIQEAIIASDPNLYQTLIDVASSHITVLVMYIDSDIGLSIASSALDTCWDRLKEDTEKGPIQMTFSGIGSFSDRVVYARLREDEHYLRLLRLAKEVRQIFSSANVCLPDEKPMHPHLTIAKMSKVHQKAGGFPRKINPAAYQLFKNIHLGCQSVSGLQLLSMTKPKDKERYYYCANEIIFEESCKERGDHSHCCFPRRPLGYV